MPRKPLEAAATLSGAPVRVPKAAQLIANSIRGEIARGDLRAGSPLPNETDLMAHFEVARPTAREALRILEAEGLIEIVRGAHGGARVRVPDVGAAARHCAVLLQLQGTTAAEVYEVRLMLEPTAARLALEEVIAEEERAVEQTSSLAEQAIRFQETLVDVAGNPPLALLVRLLHDLATRQSAARIRPDLDEATRIRLRRRLIRAQRAVVAAIRDGRGEDAETEWRRFLSGVRDELLGNRDGRVELSPRTRQPPSRGSAA
jgi:DNA-binding FadR family transcriptional regulator